MTNHKAKEKLLLEQYLAKHEAKKSKKSFWKKDPEDPLKLGAMTEGCLSFLERKFGSFWAVPIFVCFVLPVAWIVALWLVGMFVGQYIKFKLQGLVIPDKLERYLGGFPTYLVVGFIAIVAGPILEDFIPLGRWGCSVILIPFLMVPVFLFNFLSIKNRR